MCLHKKLQLFSSSAFFTVSSMCNTLGIYLHIAEPQTSSTGIKSCEVLLVFRCTVQCYRWCWRSRLSRLRPQTGNVSARNSSQDFLPFSSAHQAMLPLLLLPHLPFPQCSCFCKETDVSVQALGDNASPRTASALPWGRGNCPGTWHGAGRGFPSRLSRTLSFSSLHTYTAQLPITQMGFVPKLWNYLIVPLQSSRDHLE